MWQEFPSVRYRAAKSLDPNTMTTFRDLIPTKLAAAIWNCLMKYKSSLPNFPQTETCELIILDRSIDQVWTVYLLTKSTTYLLNPSLVCICDILLFCMKIAPIIHEWTYDAMCHDLLNMEGNKYVHQVSHWIVYYMFVWVSVNSTFTSILLRSRAKQVVFQRRKRSFWRIMTPFGLSSVTLI